MKRLPYFLILITAISINVGKGTSSQNHKIAIDLHENSIANCQKTLEACQEENIGNLSLSVTDSPTRYGRFASYLLGVDEDRQLRRANGLPILPAEIPEVYGTQDGMSIYDDGLDVCSWDYAAREGFDRPLRPVYQDLSDTAGWPDIHVTPGTVAIDPTLGRFMLAAGDEEPLQLEGSTWTGFGVPGSGFIKVQGDYAVMPAGEGDFQVLDNSDRSYPMVVGHLRVDFNWVAAVRGDYAYISQGHSGNGLSAIDISDPADPQWAGTNLWPHYANAIEIRDGYAYISTTFEPGFRVLSLVDPLNPVEVGSANLGDPDGGRWIFLSGNRAYVGLATANGLLDPLIAYGPSSAGFSIIDISDPHDPTLLGTYLGEPEEPPQTSGLIALYPYDGDPDDASGHDHHGVVYGPTSAVGLEGGAFSFDGQDDYIRNPIVVDPSEQVQLTVGAWVNAASTVPHNEQRFILSVEEELQLPCLAQDRNNGTPSSRRGWSACGEEFLFAGGEDTADEWIFLAAVYDLDPGDGSGTLTLYVQDQVYTTAISPFEGLRQNHIYVGSRKGTWPGHFHGLIDNLFIFAEALDAAQIADIQAGGAQAVLDLGDTLPVSYADPEPLPPQKLPRLIGISGDIALMAQTYIPSNYPLSQPAKLIMVDAATPTEISRLGTYLFEVDRKPEPRLDLYSAVANGTYVYISDDSQDSTGDSLNAYPWFTDDPTDYNNYRHYYEDYTSLLTFDISDPEYPALVDRYNHPQPSRFRHMTLEGVDLFINDYNYGIRVFSLTDPAHPSLSGGTTTAAEGHYAWVNDDATSAFFTQTFGGTIYSLDITDPSTPTIEGVYWDGEWSEKQRFTGRGDYLYVPTAAGLNIIDVSDPSQPLKRDGFPSVYQLPDVSLFADHAYVLTSNEPTQWEGGQNTKRFLNIYDISDPSQPLWLNESHVIDFSTRQKGVYAQGRYTYVISPNNLIVVDVLDPAQPQVIGTLSDPRLTMVDSWYPIPMQVKDGYAYIVTGERNERFFHIVDVNDPTSPEYVDTYTHTNNQDVTDIIIAGKYLYLGIYWGVFWIYDISDPVAPAFVTNSSGLPWGGWGAAWSLGGLMGEYLYVPTLSRFHLVDVPRDSQALAGPVTVDANLDPPPIYIPILFR